MEPVLGLYSLEALSDAAADRWAGLYRKFIRRHHGPRTLTKGARWMDPIRCDHAPPLPPINTPARAGRENRVHLRAYKCWADLRGGRRSPAVADLSGGTMLEIGAHCLLLDFSGDAEDPAVIYMGERLARTFDSAARTLGQALGAASGAGSPLHGLETLYRRVLATAGPAGFERETRPLEGQVLLCRGILLPFCGDGSRIDHVLVVVNWKACAVEPGESTPAAAPPAPDAAPAVWADGPGGGDPDCAAAPLRPADPWPPGDSRPCPLSPAQAQALRTLPPLPLASLAATGAEFALALVRRCDSGTVHLLAEVPDDPALLAAAARHLAP